MGERYTSRKRHRKGWYEDDNIKTLMEKREEQKNREKKRKKERER